MIGMPYKILPTKEFSKDFQKLDLQVQKRIKAKIEETAIDPTRYKLLHYDLSGSCRVWIGKIRVIFSYDTNNQEVKVKTMKFHQSI